MSHDRLREPSESCPVIPLPITKPHINDDAFQSERLITLCATDPTFTTLPASMVASASLASAVQQDYESGQPPTSGPSVRIKDIFNKIREFTRVEMVSRDGLLKLDQ